MANLDELVVQFQEGDLEALDVIYQTYKDPLYRFVYRYTANEQLSIDVVQDTFEKLQRSKNYYQAEKGSFKTYLFQIAYNTMRTKLKRQQLFNKYLPFLKEAYFAKTAAISQVEKLTVQSAVQKLPEEMRAVILLTYYHDMPQKEIAAILNIPIGTVKSRLYRALKILKAELEVDGE